MLDKARQLFIASLAYGKGMSYEDLYYSDYMSNDNKEYIDDIWDYVTEIEEIGIEEFKEIYKEYKLYF